jgi:CRISPR-associated protein Cas2
LRRQRPGGQQQERKSLPARGVSSAKGPALLADKPTGRCKLAAPASIHAARAMVRGMPNRKLHVLAYDITEDDRRARALKACKGHGLGGQKSVHECLLSRRECRELEARLRRAMDADGDRLMVLTLDPRAKIHTLGKAEQPPDPPWFYIG